jgi:CheY-like chemotaxis protein
MICSLVRQLEPEMDVRRYERVLRILVVDDNREYVNSMAMLLGLFGHQVHKAYDGLSALALAEQDWPEVVFVDLAMPEMDGFQLAKRIREQAVSRPKPKLIALTGYGDEDTRLRVAAEGFDHCFLKPMDMSLMDCLLKKIAVNRSAE